MYMHTQSYTQCVHRPFTENLYDTKGSSCTHMYIAT